jgi:integrase
MSIQKTEKGWLVDIQPGGRGNKRYRKTLPTKAEALRWRAFIENKTIKVPDWQPDKKDCRRLDELLAIWYEHHGKNLKTSEDMYSRLKWISARLKNPFAYTLTPEVFSEYRQKRLAEGLSINSMNREHAYLKSAFNELIRLGQWKKDNPVEKVRLLKVDERELTYLTQDEIKRLMQAIQEGDSEDLYLVVSICLATGARWSEAINLKRESVKNGIINYAGTKSGKFRAVPIPETLEKEILKHKPGSERLFSNCIKALQRAIKRAGLELPDGQCSHVLRHSFASHFMMNGGNILTLQKILGHQSLNMTMRYAHLSPDHLEEARALSPYAMVLNSL